MIEIFISVKITCFIVRMGYLFRHISFVDHTLKRTRIMTVNLIGAYLKAK